MITLKLSNIKLTFGDPKLSDVASSDRLPASLDLSHFCTTDHNLATLAMIRGNMPSSPLRASDFGVLD